MEFATQQIPPGEQVGPYQIIRRLGAGGMGEVYLARHRHLNRDAAVKILLAEISLNQTVVTRFFTEARATAQLRHPNIVEIFDCDILPNGRAYIVMEFLRGESLRSTLDRLGKLYPDYGSIAAITGMTADALQAAHENEIVHRDLKPDNTFLTVPVNQEDELIVKVLDFGIAKLLSGGTTAGGGTPTRTGSLIGTPLYMSPEQCRGIPNIDYRADIYSLGCMMFEMVVGQPPFVSEAPGDILMAHMVQPAPPLRALAPEIPQEIESLVARMLAKDPGERPQTMAEIVAIVEALLGTRRNDFHTMLRRPSGFPEPSATSPTQILPVAEDELSFRITPEPPISMPVGRGVAPTTPITPTPITPLSQPPVTLITTPTRAKPTPLVGDSRQKPTPVPNRKRHRTGESPSDLKTLETFNKPRFVPAMVIGLVVVVGGLLAYLLTRPSSTERESAKKVEPAAEQSAKQTVFTPPPTEVMLEIASVPEGAAVWVTGENRSRGTTPIKLTMPLSSDKVDLTLKARGFIDKQVSLDASRNQAVTINLDPREVAQGTDKVVQPDRNHFDKDPKKPKIKVQGSSGGSKPTTFKAVGD
jgi:eukaryotic-like serine/threonine-protein kinase